MSISTTPPFATGPKPISVEEALGAIRSGIDRIDAERAGGYNNLVIFRAAKKNLLTRHAQLLATKLGAENPRVLNLQGQIAATGAQLLDLGTACAVAAIPPPQPATAGFILHGIIHDANRQPLAGISAALVDADGNRRKDFLTAVTDANGYFKLETAQLIPIGATAGESENAPASVALTLIAFQNNRQPLPLTLPTITAAPGNSQFVAAVVGAAVGPIPSTPDKRGRRAGADSSTFSAATHAHLKTLIQNLKNPAHPPGTTPASPAPGIAKKKTQQTKPAKRAVAKEKSARRRKKRSH